tara:strand:+ start:1237 stop:1872 length:636 start_codon:yes stop_codon:yes gene_type:complete
MDDLFCFDIETGPLDAQWQLNNFEPQFQADKRLKDSDKIADDIASKRDEWIAESPLRAERGEVLAIGYSHDGKVVHILTGKEDDILRNFIAILSASKSQEDLICGFNILGFDLPFIRRRCVILGIDFPYYSRMDKWKPWRFEIFDAMVDWQSGDRRASISLDKLARGLGVGKKNGHGAMFHQLLKTDPDAAMDYLTNDVMTTWAVCEKLLS